MRAASPCHHLPVQAHGGRKPDWPLPPPPFHNLPLPTCRCSSLLHWTRCSTTPCLPPRRSVRLPLSTGGRWHGLSGRPPAQSSFLPEGTGWQVLTCRAVEEGGESPPPDPVPSRWGSPKEKVSSFLRAMSHKNEPVQNVFPAAVRAKLHG